MSARQLLRVLARQANEKHAPASHRRAAASLLDWSEIPDGSGAKQSEEMKAAAFVGKAARASAGQTGKTVCIRLAPKSSRKLASSSCQCWPNRQNSLHPPHTAEQPQACSTGRRSVTQSKEDERRQPVLASSSSECRSVQNSLHLPHTKELVQACSTGSEIRDGARAKQRGRKAGSL